MIDRFDERYDSGIETGRWSEVDDVDAQYDLGVVPEDSSQPDIDDDFGTDEPFEDDDQPPDTKHEHDEGVAADHPRYTEQPRRADDAASGGRDAAHKSPVQRTGRTEKHFSGYAYYPSRDRERQHPLVRRKEDSALTDHGSERREADERAANLEAMTGYREKVAGGFGERLSKDPSRQANIMGGSALARETAMFHTAMQDVRETRAAQLSGERRENVRMLMASFSPSEEEPLISQAAVPEVYEVDATSVAGPEGFMTRLYSDEMAEVVSRAAAGDDPNALRAFKRILVPLAKAVGTESYDPHTRTVRTLAPDLETLGYALSQVRGGGLGADYSKLDIGQEQRVDAAIIKPDIERSIGAIDTLSAFVDDLRMSAENANAALAGAGARNYQTPLGASRFGERAPKLTVETVGVTDADDSQNALLSHGLLPYVKAVKPDVLMIQDADLGDVAALERAVREVRRYEGKVYISVDSVQDEAVQKLVQRGAHAVLKLSNADDATVVSRILGTIDGEEITGESINVGGNEGKSANQSVNEGFEGESSVAKTKGVSGATDRSNGIQVGVTQNVQIGDIPSARPGHLRLIGDNQMAVFGSGGERYGRYSLTSLQRESDFPPAGPERFRAEEHLARIAAAQGLPGLPGVSPEALRAAQGTTRALGAAAASTDLRPGEIRLPRTSPKDELETLEPHGRLNRLRQDFGYKDSFGFGGRKASKEFQEYLMVQAGKRGMLPEDFRRWIGL